MMFADFSNSHGHSTPSISSIDGTRFVIAQDSYLPNSDLALPFAADAPLRSLADFATAGQTLTPETMLHVRDARVIFANYGAVLADFAPALLRHLPSPDPGGAACRQAIDEWLVGHAACVSVSQAASSAVSTPIPLDGTSRRVWRPPRYGRAAVMVDQASDAIFDVKGIGVPPDEQPWLPNSNGLMTLEEAVHEVLMEHLVFAVMQRAGVDVRPLPSYAVLDLGFDAVWHDGRAPQRATALVRRAATRPRCQWSRAVQGREMAHTLMQIELLLRSCGISASVCGAVRLRLTAADRQRRIFRDEDELTIPEDRKAAVFAAAGWSEHDVIVDGVNVQVTSDLQSRPLRARLMDFGRYSFRERFDTVMYSWFDAEYLSMNGAYLRPNDASYVQPDRECGLARFENSEPHSALFDAVDRYQSGSAERSDVAAAMRRAVHAAACLLDSAPQRAAPAPARPRSVPDSAGAGLAVAVPPEGTLAGRA